MKNKKKKQIEYECHYCKSKDTYECGIKKGDYLCNNCGEHFNIYDKYIQGIQEPINKVVQKFIIALNEMKKNEKTKSKKR
jgi:ribosomal protein L37AE/L43A